MNVSFIYFTNEWISEKKKADYINEMQHERRNRTIKRTTKEEEKNSFVCIEEASVIHPLSSFIQRILIEWTEMNEFKWIWFWWRQTSCPSLFAFIDWDKAEKGSIYLQPIDFWGRNRSSFSAPASVPLFCFPPFVTSTQRPLHNNLSTRMRMRLKAPTSRLVRLTRYLFSFCETSVEHCIFHNTTSIFKSPSQNDHNTLLSLFKQAITDLVFRARANCKSRLSVITPIRSSIPISVFWISNLNCDRKWREYKQNGRLLITHTTESKLNKIKNEWKWKNNSRNGDYGQATAASKLNSNDRKLKCWESK